jgi:hypothetical protein
MYMCRAMVSALRMAVLAVVVFTALAGTTPTAAVSRGDKRFVNATGSTMYEVGVSIGKQQKETIAQMFAVRLDFYKSSKGGGERVAMWPKYANASLTTIAKHAPSTLEEMRGVADGAELPLTTLLQLATDYEGGLWLNAGLPGPHGDAAAQLLPNKACTAFGWANSTSGRVFVGQNNDEKHTEFLNGTLDAVIARPAVNNPHGPPVTTISYSHPGMPAYM